MKNEPGLIRIVLAASILFLFLVFTKPAQAATQIYPYSSTAGPANSYSLRPSTCDGGPTTCYDQSPESDENMWKTETDEVITYKPTGGAWRTAYQHGCCQDFDWMTVEDNTRNHSTAAVTYAQQLIKIPSNISKITKVTFYKIYYFSPAQAVLLSLKLYLNDPNQGYPQVGSTVNMTLDQRGEYYDGPFGSGVIDWANWVVTPGQSYWIRLERTDGGNIALPVSSSCGAVGGNCRWWGDWGEGWSNVVHSSTDVYPDGYAYSGTLGTDATNNLYFDDYLNKVNGVRKADIARMAVWGVPECGNVSNLSPSGNITPGTYSLTWTNAAGATLYGVRINDLANGWTGNCGTSSPTNPINIGDLCQDNVTSGSVSYNFQAGYNYNWWVYTHGDCNSPTNTSATVTPSIPTLGVLNIDADTTTGGVKQGSYGTSGLRADQEGSNYYNALRVKQNITNGTSTNYDLAGVVFTQSGTSAPAADSNLATLKQSANSNNGFVIVYANCKGNASCQEDGKTFYKGKSYLYFNNAWYEVPNIPSLLNAPGYLDVGTISNSHTVHEFTVYLYNGLGNRTWGTYGYLKYGSTTKSKSLDPSPIP